MGRVLYSSDNLDVFERSGKFYIRYDAGAHQIEMREDEISEEEAKEASSGEVGATRVLFALQKRLIDLGIDPYKANAPRPPYTPKTKGELLEVHAALFLSAPDNFFQVSNALHEEHQTLESTVAELHRGVDHVYRMSRHEKARARLHEVIDATYAEFKAGRVHEGRMMCHQIEDLIENTRP